MLFFRRNSWILWRATYDQKLIWSQNTLGLVLLHKKSPYSLCDRLLFVLNLPPTNSTCHSLVFNLKKRDNNLLLCTSSMSLWFYRYEKGFRPAWELYLMAMCRAQTRQADTSALQACLEKPCTVSQSEHSNPFKSVAPSVPFLSNPEGLCCSSGQSEPAAAQGTWAREKILPTLLGVCRAFWVLQKGLWGISPRQLKVSLRGGSTTRMVCQGAAVSLLGTVWSPSTGG